ncbi:hypothetical protein [Kineosporia babensis]|nr:hypothetical protein [Kineosporia babensis]
MTELIGLLLFGVVVFGVYAVGCKAASLPIFNVKWPWLEGH